MKTLFSKKQLIRDVSDYRDQLYYSHFHDDYLRSLFESVLCSCELVLSCRCTNDKLIFVCECLNRLQRILIKDGFNVHFFNYLTGNF